MGRTRWCPDHGVLWGTCCQMPEDPPASEAQLLDKMLEEGFPDIRETLGGDVAENDTERVTASAAVKEATHRGHYRMALRFARENAGRLIYVPELRAEGWHVWDGLRWAENHGGAPTRAVGTSIRRAIREAAGLEGDQRRELLKDARLCESAAGVRGVLTIAQALEPLDVPIANLDADPFLLVTRSGTLDLRTGKLRPNKPGDYCTKVTGCEYDPKAWEDNGAEFRQFLDEILPDKEVQGFLQRVFGMALRGVSKDQILVLLTGTGANGKSTLIELMLEMFGDYGTVAEPNLLMERRDTNTAGIADLLGVRLATASETDQGGHFSVSKLKSLTGDRKLKARRLYQQLFEFDASHTLIMATNHPPKVDGNDPAAWRRLRVVPFDVVIPEDKRDVHLPDRLRKELPAMLGWALLGYQAYVTYGLQEPAAVMLRTQEYRDENDAIARFLGECTVSAPNTYVRAKDLYTAWSRWARENHEDELNSTAFGRALTARETPSKSDNAGKLYCGFYLPAPDESADAFTVGRGSRD